MQSPQKSRARIQEVGNDQAPAAGQSAPIYTIHSNKEELSLNDQWLGTLMLLQDVTASILTCNDLNIAYI